MPCSEGTPIEPFSTQRRAKQQAYAKPDKKSHSSASTSYQRLPGIDVASPMHVAAPPLLVPMDGMPAAAAST